MDVKQVHENRTNLTKLEAVFINEFGSEYLSMVSVLRITRVNY